MSDDAEAYDPFPRLLGDDTCEIALDDPLALLDELGGLGFMVRGGELFVLMRESWKWVNIEIALKRPTLTAVPNTKQ